MLRTAHGVTSTDLVASGHIRLVNTAAGVDLRVDVDGFAGAAAGSTLASMPGLSAAQIDVGRDLIQ